MGDVEICGCGNGGLKLMDGSRQLKSTQSLTGDHQLTKRMGMSILNPILTGSYWWNFHCCLREDFKKAFHQIPIFGSIGQDFHKRLHALQDFWNEDKISYMHVAPCRGE